MNTRLITVSGVCGLSLLHVYTCVSCSISILFLYTYVRMPSSPGSIAGVPSRKALLGYLITAPPSVCVPAVLGALVVWIQHPKNRALLLLRNFRAPLLLRNIRVRSQRLGGVSGVAAYTQTNKNITHTQQTAKTNVRVNKVTPLSFTPVAGLNLLKEKVLILGTFSSNVNVNPVFS